MKKEHQVVLMRNGEKVEESILTYPTRKKAEEIAEYLNSLIPPNLHSTMNYVAIDSDLEEEI